MNDTIHLVECPRDAMQGWKHFIPTEKKVRYLEALLRVGFDTIDFGSFVSPKAIPQMADTAGVISRLSLKNSRSKLLAIIANTRGAEEAGRYEAITYLGFPFSISPTFQKRNTNSTLEESLKTVEDIHSICQENNKQPVVYISMGFGNPYGDVYNEEIVLHWVDKIVNTGIKIISLADTVGLATAPQVSSILEKLIPSYPSVQFGVHLHSSPVNFKSKLEAAFSAGCRRFDGALMGIGGCPMADDELVGNMDTEKIINWLEENKIPLSVDLDALKKAVALAREVFI
jgi:hydroxymethylglutaryl-CoA lyase